mmetsp:Transcript_81512/g.236330  ORF Transcript_81512/g.236330 Transcript_81512/m.236330 type:complete len:112 (-) Transcript_81512:23-358(-)
MVVLLKCVPGAALKVSLFSQLSIHHWRIFLTSTERSFIGNCCEQQVKKEELVKATTPSSHHRLRIAAIVGKRARTCFFKVQNCCERKARKHFRNDNYRFLASTFYCLIHSK